MTDIIEAIDAWTEEEYSELNQKLFGFCELMRKSAAGNEQPMPVTIEGRKQVALDDRRELVTWIRMSDTVQTSNSVEDQDWAFGLDDAPVQYTTLRWVVAHKTTLGEKFIHNLLKAVPSMFEVEGYQIISVNKSSSSIDTEHESIYNAEFGNNNYEKHRFTWNLYVINLNIEYIICETSE
jgi:hypothetical protein